MDEKQDPMGQEGPSGGEGNNDAEKAAADFIAKVTAQYLDFDKNHPYANILIAGKTGVGKSTLINTVFREELAATGIGSPVTPEIREITKPGVPLSIIDTKGLELADFTPIRNDILSYIDNRKGEDARTYVNVAWLCIASGGARIEDAELDLAKALKAAGLAVIVVLTKVARFKNNDFEAVVREKFYDITTDVILTRALSEDICDEEERVIGQNKVQGIDQLLEVTYARLPEAQRYSFANASSISHKKAQEIKAKEAGAAINYFSLAAAGVGAVPIPFSDAALLAPIQAGMILKISGVYGMDISVPEIPGVMAKLVGVTGTVSTIGKNIVTTALKMIPGAGSLVGGAIAASTAGALTKTLGGQYAGTLASLGDRGVEITLDTAISELRKKLPL